MPKSLQFTPRSRIDAHVCFDSDGPTRDSKIQFAIRGPAADYPRVPVLNITLDDVACTRYATHMGHANSCAVYIGGEAPP